MPNGEVVKPFRNPRSQSVSAGKEIYWTKYSPWARTTASVR